MSTASNSLFQNFNKILLITFIFLAGCAQTEMSGDGVYDPAEPLNRGVHGFNKAADRAVLRPASRAYGYVVPDPVDTMISNGVSNLSLPSDVINHTLQGDFEAALDMTARFVINSTIGVLGLFDPASAVNVPDDSTDFGETLHVWGVNEGAYVELPLLGPSTTRDTVGAVVDTLANPLGQILPSQELEATYVLQGLDVLGTRHKLAGVIDPVLYGANDSYAAARIGYLLNRRNVLQGGELNEADLDDPFAFDN